MRKLKLFLSVLMLMAFSVGTWATDYQLVTDVASLSAGDKIIIVETGGTKAISTTQNSSNRGAANVTVSDNKITPSESVQILTLSKTSNYWELYTGSGYLYASSSSSNQLKTQTTNNANGQWTITITDGVASIVANRTGRNTMQYNSASTIFACYASASQTNLKIFKEVAAPTLSSIAVKTAPAKVVYTEGEYFNPTGLVITGTYSDASTSDVAYAGHESDFTFSPTTSTALTTSNDKVTIAYGGKSVDQAITVNAAAACTNTVEVIKGSETNGTYTLSATEVCGDDDGGVVFITNISPEEGYELDDITATSGTVDKENNKVTGIKAATTITVTFKELPKYKVSFDTGAGNPAQVDITEASYGAGITLPAGPTPACSADGWSFAGWAEAAVAEQTTTAPTLLAAGANYKPTDNVTLYAVYKRTEEGGGSITKYVSTAANEMVAGTYVIAALRSDAASIYYYPATGEISSGDMNVTDGDNKFTLTDGAFETIPTGGIEFTFSGNKDDGFTIAKPNGDKLGNTSTDSRKLAFNSSYNIAWKVVAHNSPLNTNGITLQSSNYKISENSTAVGAIRGYGNNAYRAIYLFKKTEVTPSTTYYLSAPSCCTKHTITVDDAIEFGSIEADLAEACEGTTVTLTATPDENCQFVSWSVNSGAVTVTDNQFSMPDGNVTVTATFAEIKNTVTITTPEGGTLSVLNGETPVATSTSIKKGTALTVTATPNAENHYIGGVITVKDGEENDVTASVLSGSTLTMPGYAITISASFTPTYKINLVAEGGSIALDYTAGGAAEGYAIAGSEIMATATEDGAHTFSALALSENITVKEIDDNVATFTMPAEAVTITATFAEKAEPTIGVSTSSIVFDAVDYKDALAAEVFTVSGVALAAGQLTIACDNDAFEVSPKAINVDGTLAETDVTVTPKTTSCGTFNGTITISGGSAAAVNVSVKLTVNKLANGLAWKKGDDVATEATVTIDANDNVFPTLYNPLGLEGIEYSSYDDEVASINVSTGAIELKKAGLTYIVANFAGNDTVAALAEDALSYALTVQKKYTATWYLNGEALTESTQTAIEGTALIVPADPTKLADDCADMVFMGWATAPVAKQASAPDTVITAGLEMGNADANYYAVFAKVKENISVTEYQYTIPLSDFNKTSYAANNNEKTVNAVCTTDDSKKQEVKYTTNQVMLSSDGTYIQGQKNAGYIYNAAAWGSKVKSITINGNENFTYVIGASAQPTATAEGAFFKISAGSSTSKATSIDIVFEVTNKSTSYIDFMTTCPTCQKVTLVKAGETNGSLTIKEDGVEVSSVKTCEAAELTVEATPATGYELDGVAVSGVEGAAYNAGVISIPQDAAGTLTVTATFTAINYTVTMEQTGGAEAEISGNQENKHYGNEITVTAGEKAGYYFLGWAADVEVAFADAKAYETTFPMPASNVKVTAKYAKIMTVSEAIPLIPNQDDKYENAVVMGYISAAATSDKAGTLTYNVRAIDASGFLTGSELLVFRGKGLNGADFANTTDVEVGAKVLIYGQLKNYEGTREFSSTNYLLSYDAPGAASIVVYGEAEKTYYEYGDPFQFDGLKAKQLYENGYATEIETPEWSADPAAIIANGEVTATATWNLMNGSTKVGVEVLMHEIDFNASPDNGTLVVTDLNNTGDPVADGAKFVRDDELKIEAFAAAGYKLETLTVNGADFTNGDTYKVGTEDIVIVATFVKDSGTAIDNTEASVKAVKMIENGVLIIRRGDKSFNAQGQLIR